MVVTLSTRSPDCSERWAEGTRSGDVDQVIGRHSDKGSIGSVDRASPALSVLDHSTVRGESTMGRRCREVYYGRQEAVPRGTGEASADLKDIQFQDNDLNEHWTLTRELYWIT